jgi:hypothetical protein
MTSNDPWTEIDVQCVADKYSLEEVRGFLKFSSDERTLQPFFVAVLSKMNDKYYYPEIGYYSNPFTHSEDLRSAIVGRVVLVLLSDLENVPMLLNPKNIIVENKVFNDESSAKYARYRLEKGF